MVGNTTVLSSQVIKARRRRQRPKSVGDDDSQPRSKGLVIESHHNVGRAHRLGRWPPESPRNRRVSETCWPTKAMIAYPVRLSVGLPIAALSFSALDRAIKPDRNHRLFGVHRSRCIQLLLWTTSASSTRSGHREEPVYLWDEGSTTRYLWHRRLVGRRGHLHSVQLNGSLPTGSS